MLVIARTLQGAFGAILAPAALGTLVSTFRDPRERGKAFGVFGSVAAGGGAVGLILGGVLTQYLSWRYTLYVNLIFAAIAITGALVYLRSSRPANPPRLDWAGTVLASSGLFLLVFGFSHAETAGWTGRVTIACLVVGVLLLVGFVLAEQRVSHPLLPLRVILDRTRGGAYLAVGVASVSLFGAFLFLTYYLQTIKGYSPVTAGLAFLPMVGGLLVSANLSSNVLLPRVGPRILISSGLLTGAAAMAYLTQLSVTSSYAGGVLPALILLGLGFGMILAPAINTATAGVRPQDSGVAAALVNTMQQVGGSIGAAASWVIAAICCAGIVFGLYAGRQRRARFRFPQRPMWAEYVIAVVGCFVVLGATAIVNSYPWPERVAAAYAEANNIPVPEGGLVIATGYAIPVLIALVTGVVMTFLARRTRFGRYVYATGGNPEAAELAGVNTKRITILVFALMGALAGIAACIDSARLDSATNVLGQFDELYVIAAAVIGGTSLAGGVGTIYGALIGALVIQSLQSGMVLLGLDSAFQQMVVGVVLVGAVGLDTFYRRRTAKG